MFSKVAGFMSCFGYETLNFSSKVVFSDRLLILKRHLSMANKNGQTYQGATAGIIVIGDEIIKGQVQDTNSHFLCKRLFTLGVQVKKISVITDDLDEIASEVSQFSGRYTHVFTTGGIGPTHDDVTFEGIAKAFGESVYGHPDLVALCKHYFGTDDMESPKLKMAKIPESAKLLYGTFKNKTDEKKPRYPVVNVRNVYIFPGVPTLMEKAFMRLEDMFRDPGRELHVKEIYIDMDEISITPALNNVVEKFKDRVIFGSYPQLNNSYYKVKLTLQAEDSQSVSEACSHLNEQLPAGCIVNYDKYPIRDASDHVFDLMEQQRADDCMESKLEHSVEVIEEALRKYSAEEICVGFNGGKDCTALLHLVYAVANRRYEGKFKKLKALYIRRGQPFPEIELFIKTSVENYNLDVISIHGRIKPAMEQLKQQHPDIKAVIMGTRKTDPFSNHLESFSMTDPDWPQFMRVNPILDWSYTEVWAFLRKLNIPYCSLYDRGYTSLGSMENTHPNPSLQQVDNRGIISYQPAYLLDDGQSERAGRN